MKDAAVVLEGTDHAVEAFAEAEDEPRQVMSLSGDLEWQVRRAGPEGGKIGPEVPSLIQEAPEKSLRYGMPRNGGTYLPHRREETLAADESEEE